MARPSGADGILDGRGVATADFDGDGRLDLAINNNNSQPTFYMNRLTAGNWMRLELVGDSGNRDAVGAKIRLTVADKTLTRWVEAGSGYAAQSAFPVHFGLGSAEWIDNVEITWPSGESVQITGADLGINRMVRIEESGGMSVAATEVVATESDSAGG